MQRVQRLTLQCSYCIVSTLLCKSCMRTLHHTVAVHIMQSNPVGAAGWRSAPTVQWVTGFSNRKCESHPHAGVQLHDGGYLMIGDSVCYGQPLSPLKRSVFVVRAHSNGSEAWSRTLGDVGFNYGKFGIELADSTLLVAGSMSLVDPAGTAAGYPFVERRALARLSPTGDLLQLTRFNASSPDDPGRRDGFMCVVPSNESDASGGLVVYATGYGGGDSGYNPITGYDEAPMFFISGGNAFITKLSFPRTVDGVRTVDGFTPAPPTIVYDRMLPTAVLGQRFVAMQGMRVVLGGGGETPRQAVVLAQSHENASAWPVHFGFIGIDQTRGFVRWARLHKPPRNHPWTQSHPFAFAAVPGGGYVAAGHTIEVRPSTTGKVSFGSSPYTASLTNTALLGGYRLSPASGAHLLKASEMPTGRAVKIDDEGKVVWDTRFLATDDQDLNTECYGVAGLRDGSERIAITCGTGVEPEDHPKDTPTQKTWRVFNALLSAKGSLLWDGNLTDRAKLQNNAGEFVVATQDGGMAVYVDAQSWGSQVTGGNFGLMKLAAQPEGERAGPSEEEKPSPTVERFADTAAIPARAPPGHLEWPPPAPYSHVVKDLGAAAAVSPASCEAACLAYRNMQASPVSGWTRCRSFTHLAAQNSSRRRPRCVGVVDASEWHPKKVNGAVAGRVFWPPERCATVADCSFNGECSPSHHVCRCDVEWTGDRCQTLALEPTTTDAGLRIIDERGANVSSWGGAVLLDETVTPPLYHMWASEIAASCGIEAWRSNSRIVHATSSDGVRFKRRGIVFAHFAHEPTVARAPTGEWVMWFTGDPEGTPAPMLCTQCAGGNTLANTTCKTGYTVNGPTYLSFARSPFGPWSTPQRLFASQANLTNLDTNLAATILSNGSVVGIGRTGGPPTGIIAHLVTADDWRNPDSYVGRWSEMLFPNVTRLPNAGVEDPYVWHDAKRGVFHAVFHSQIEDDDERLCGGHAFSEDGVQWTFGGTAWSNRVSLIDAATRAPFEYSFSRRERPHLVFDAHGTIVALTTGVQFGDHSPTYRKGEDACYTLLQPVRRVK